MIRNSFHILLLIVCISVSDLEAQGYVLKHFTSQDGLPNDEIFCVVQDNRGLLWIGTDNGLSSFDGQQFRSYSTPDGLPGTSITSLLIDDQGDLWVGAYRKGQSIRVTTAGVSQFQVKRTYTAGADMIQWGDLYYDLYASSLMISSRDSFFGAFSDFFPQELRPYVNNPARFVLEKSPDNKELWLGTRVGLYWYDGKEFSGSVLPDHQNKEVISEITHLNDGTTLLGTLGKVKLIRRGKYLRTYPLGVSDSARVHRIIYKDEEAWISVEGYGLLSLDLTTGIVTDRKAEFGIESKYIQALFEDKDGNLWIGTRENGIYCLQKSLLVEQPTTEGLCEQKITGLEVLPSGELVVRSPTGMSILTPDGRLNPYYCSTGARTYGSIYLDKRHFLLTALSNRVSNKLLRTSAALVLDEKQILVSDYLQASEDERNQFVISEWNGDKWVEQAIYRSDLPSKGTSIRHIFQAPSGQIWLQSSPDSLFEVITPFVDRRFVDSSITTRRYFLPDIIRAFSDEEGSIWVCGKGYVWRKRLDETAFDTVYSKGPFFDMGLGENGRIWVVSQSTMVSIVDESISQHPVNGFPELGQIETMLVDEEHDRLWLAGRAGLYHLSVDSLLTRRLPTIAPMLDGILVNQEQQSQLDSLRLELGDNIQANISSIVFFSGMEVRFRHRINQGNWVSDNSGAITFPSNEPGIFAVEVQAGLPESAWSESIVIQYEVVRGFWQRPLVFVLLVCVIAAGAFLIARVQIRRIRRRGQHEKEIQQEMHHLEQQALAAMLNPHFVFNSLNSIQQELLEDDPLLAHRHLSRFAKLIRKNMDLSSRPVVKLKEELDRLALYLDMEKLRLGDRVRIHIQVEDCIPQDRVKIPSMILQPYVENAIWHGILESGKDGEVRIIIGGGGSQVLQILIEDDGIGIVESQKRKGPSKHNSMGMQITARRIKLFHEDAGVSIGEISSGEGSSSGTRVKITLPQSFQLNCDS